MISASGVLLLLAACCRPNEMSQEFVDEVYPPDCHRIDIVESFGEPHQSGRVAEKTPVGFVAAMIRSIEAEARVKVASWDYYMTFRGGPGASLGAVGLNGDYLFYTKDDVLICARRRFID